MIDTKLNDLVQVVEKKHDDQVVVMIKMFNAALDERFTNKLEEQFKLLMDRVTKTTNKKLMAYRDLETQRMNEVKLAVKHSGHKGNSYQ